MLYVAHAKRKRKRKIRMEILRRALKYSAMMSRRKGEEENGREEPQTMRAQTASTRGHKASDSSVCWMRRLGKFTAMQRRRLLSCP
jgi:hypothetical protein